MTFRLSLAPLRSSSMEMMLITRPAKPTASMAPEATSGASPSRLMASTTTYTPTASIASTANAEANTSAR